MTDDMMFGENNITKPTAQNHITLDTEEMFRRSTMQWSYHDMHDIMGDGKRLPKAQKIYRQHYDFVRSCLRRHYIYKEKIK